MPYDFEKYRIKREKVLGVRSRGLSFGAVAMIVTALIFLGLGVIVVPKTIAYWQTRNLEDIILKLADHGAIPAADVLARMRSETGVVDVLVEKDKGRLVITFDRTKSASDKLVAALASSGVETVLLNEMSHSHRMSTLEKEAAFE